MLYRFLIPVLCLFLFGPFGVLGREKRKIATEGGSYSQIQSEFSVGLVYYLGSEVSSSDQRTENFGYRDQNLYGNQDKEDKYELDSASFGIRLQQAFIYHNMLFAPGLEFFTESKFKDREAGIQPLVGYLNVGYILDLSNDFKMTFFGGLGMANIGYDNDGYGFPGQGNNNNDNTNYSIPPSFRFSDVESKWGFMYQFGLGIVIMDQWNIDILYRLFSSEVEATRHTVRNSFQQSGQYYPSYGGSSKVYATLKVSSPFISVGYSF